MLKMSEYDKEELKLLLREVAGEVFREVAKEIMNESQSVKKTGNSLYTKKETAKLLNISLPTLDSYINKKFITARRIGTRILFSNEDITAALKISTTRKYKKQNQYEKQI
jgi:excisionase family DNA binding protein